MSRCNLSATGMGSRGSFRRDAACGSGDLCDEERQTGLLCI